MWQVTKASGGQTRHLQCIALLLTLDWIGLVLPSGLLFAKQVWYSEL